MYFLFFYTKNLKNQFKSYNKYKKNDQKKKKFLSPLFQKKSIII